MNMQPYILEQGIAARHSDLVREANAGRLARRSSRRRRLFGSWLGLAPRRGQRLAVRPTLEPEL
jgi:hypothetical protein